MLPMSMMKAVVAYQMDDRKPPLPPVEQMIGDAKARIAKREERIARIEAAVMAVLEQRSVGSLTALIDILAKIIADDPNGAAPPQLENIRLAVADIGEIYESTVKAVEKSNHQLSQKAQQNLVLQGLLKQLQYTLEWGNGSSQIQGFLGECSDKGASYVAKH